MTSPTRRSSWLIARDLFDFYLKWILGLWLVLVAVIGGIVAVIAVYGEPTVSIFAFVLNPAPYWILVTGAVLPAALLRVYVSNGVTRRSFVIGGTVASLGICAILAVLGTIALYAERLVYSAAGWKHAIETTHLFTSTDQVGFVFLELLLIFGSHMFVGWAAGAGFCRFGAWAIPGALLAYLLAVGVDISMGTGWAGRVVIDNVHAFTPSWPPAVAAGVAAMSVLVAVSWRLLRDIPVPAKGS